MKRLLALALGLALMGCFGCARQPGNPDPALLSTTAATTTEAPSTTQFVAKISRRDALRLVGGDDYDLEHPGTDNDYEMIVQHKEHPQLGLNCRGPAYNQDDGSWHYWVVSFETAQYPAHGSYAYRHFVVNAMTGEVTDIDSDGDAVTEAVSTTKFVAKISRKEAVRLVGGDDYDYDHPEIDDDYCIFVRHKNSNWFLQCRESADGNYYVDPYEFYNGHYSNGGVYWIVNATTGEVTCYNMSNGEP